MPSIPPGMYVGIVAFVAMLFYTAWGIYRACTRPVGAAGIAPSNNSQPEQETGLQHGTNETATSKTTRKLDISKHSTGNRGIFGRIFGAGLGTSSFGGGGGGGGFVSRAPRNSGFSGGGVGGGGGHEYSGGCGGCTDTGGACGGCTGASDFGGGGGGCNFGI